MIEYNFSGKKILVVEDEEVNWMLIKDIFEDTSARLFWAKIGQEAIDLIASGEEFDLVLMDMKLPLKDGFQTTTEIREINSDIPIIAQTAYAMPEERKRCLEVGCDYYISKPIEIDELLKITSQYIK